MATQKVARLGLRIPPDINQQLKKEAQQDYMTKNQKAIEIFRSYFNKKSEG